MRLLLALAALCVLAGAPARATVLETDPHIYPIPAAHRVHLEFPVGELKVVPSDEPRVRFELRVRCTGASDERCEELANRLILDSTDENGTLHLELHKYPKWRNHGMKLMGELRVPRSLAVHIEMGVGDLDIEGIEGDLDVDLGVGDADVRASRTRVGSVSVEAGIGDASIRGAGTNVSRSSFIGSTASWSGGGSGRSDVRLHVGVGDATVRLD